MCGKKEGRRLKEIHGGGMKLAEAVSWKKEAQEVMCKNSTEENKRRYKSMKRQRKQF